MVVLDVCLNEQTAYTKKAVLSGSTGNVMYHAKSLPIVSKGAVAEFAGKALLVMRTFETKLFKKSGVFNRKVSRAVP